MLLRLTSLYRSTGVTRTAVFTKFIDTSLDTLFTKIFWNYSTDSSTPQHRRIHHYLGTEEASRTGETSSSKLVLTNYPSKKHQQFLLSVFPLDEKAQGLFVCVRSFIPSHHSLSTSLLMQHANGCQVQFQVISCNLHMIMVNQWALCTSQFIYWKCQGKVDADFFMTSALSS